MQLCEGWSEDFAARGCKPRDVSFLQSTLVDLEAEKAAQGAL